MSISNNDNVPEIAIRWIVEYSCTTNCYLASLSNVNKKWRSIIESFFKDKLEYYYNCKIYYQEEDSTDDDDKHYYFLSLLLPEMALEILRRSNEFLKVLNESQYQHHQEQQQQQIPQEVNQYKRGSFCLSWFAPSGIKTQSVNLDAINDDDYNIHDDELLMSSSNSSNKDEDEDDEMIFYRQRALQRQRAAATAAEASTSGAKGNVNDNGQSHSSTVVPTTEEEETVENCCYEWLGYRHAIDILQPLGYAETFVEVCVNIHMDRLFMKLFVYLFRCCIIS